MGASMSDFESEAPIVMASLPQNPEPLQEVAAEANASRAENALKAIASAATLAEWVNAGLHVNARDWSELLRKSSDVNLPSMVLAEASAPIAAPAKEADEGPAVVRSAVGISGNSNAAFDQLMAGVFEARVINPELKTAAGVVMTEARATPSVEAPALAEGVVAPMAVEAPVVQQPLVEELVPVVAPEPVPVAVDAVPVAEEPIVEAALEQVVEDVVVTPIVVSLAPARAEVVVEPMVVEVPVVALPTLEEQVSEVTLESEVAQEPVLAAVDPTPVAQEPVVEAPFEHVVETVEVPVMLAPTYFYLLGFDPARDSISLSVPGVASVSGLLTASAIYEEEGSVVIELNNQSAIFVITGTDLDTVQDAHLTFDEAASEISAQVVEGLPPEPEAFAIGLDTGRVHVGSFDVGTDVVRIGGDLATSFDGLQENAAIYQDGHATVVEFHNGHDILVLANVDVRDVSPEMFQFDEAAPTASETFHLGTEFNDELIFGTGAQMIDPGKGFDVITGGAGADTFLFHAQSDRDFITDFTIGEDRIQIDQAWFADFDAMMDEAVIYQDGGSTQVEFGGGQIITLYGVEASKVTQDSFVYV